MLSVKKGEKQLELVFQTWVSKTRLPKGEELKVASKKNNIPKKKCQKNMCKKNETGFQNTLEFPKNDFKEKSPELLKKTNQRKELSGQK